ncbi:NADPH oxidase [Reticulomyxa filosa]|uniref:NADPH oxidase n=1 Tax=Reticulomyxa filosa TaxID=46433 RepID=X6LTI0_RETFI|nr:NADPH oxidase [Reticulomyxa filosa]|eukprot:ETO05243.1 NADPH oxidase [Reticulomyxa filosa]
MFYFSFNLIFLKKFCHWLKTDRSFIASLYNISTDQRATSRAARFCLSFVPLDKAIQFHKVCAFLSALGGILHTWAHYNHYAQVPATYDAVYGATVWVSGVIIIVAMQLLYSTSFEAVRRGKFELFWYTHHLFVIFFLALLFHGHKSWNPNYWKWFLVPGSLYLIERVTREVKASKPVGLISVTHMNNKSAKVFCLELEKTGPIRSHQEGQYVFLNCPIITKFQWHPFTISSPPEQKTLTLHIRNMVRTYKVFMFLEEGGMRRKKDECKEIIDRIALYQI